LSLSHSKKNSSLTLSQITKEDEGFKNYSVVLDETTCVLRHYTYAVDDMAHVCVWYDFAIGVVGDDQVDRLVARTAIEINDQIHSYRVRVESLGRGKSLITLLFREDIERITPDYAVDVVAAAAEKAAELRQVLRIETIAKLRVS
jgi:hypothetical protein